MKPFDCTWKFLRGDVANAEQPWFDESAWRTVEAPHDWSIEDVPGTDSPFHPAASIGGAATGWTVGGIGWYRKRFVCHPQQGRRFELLFDGVYANCDVWLNGTHLGFNPNGYMPFGFDLTPHLAASGENVLALRVRNEGHNSRWYSGSGLIRPALVRETGLVYVPAGGVFVTTPRVANRCATVHASIEVRNQTGADQSVTVTFVLRGPGIEEGLVTTAQSPIRSGATEVIERDFEVADPHLWYPWDLLDPAGCVDPVMYQLESRVSVAGVESDAVLTSFGIRTVALDAASGLRVNGRACHLRGGCVHHDNGILGAAAIERAEVRRVELLRAAGFNAIRTSHNPPSTAFLDACDRLGMLVIDEAFDEWERHKTPASYAGYFAEWCEKDVAAMVRRDRNHPSVVFWSIGNEIIETFVRPDIALKLREECLRHDSTRPITQGVCRPWWKPVSWVDWDTSSAVGFQHLDVGGYNYEWAVYESDHSRHPDRIMMGTESFPDEAYENWDQVLRHPWVIGDFVWTALDYIGESGIGQRYLAEDGLRDGAYPYHLAVCGDLDLLGRRKPQSYYREALWRPGVLHAAVVEPEWPGHSRIEEGWHHKWGWTAVQSHWTWPGQEGKPLTVEVYSSCERVTVFLNGRPVGEAPTGWEERRRASFQVPYEPGELKVVGTIGGRTVEHLLRTAGPPRRLQLVPDRRQIGLDGGDLSFVDVFVVDESGVVVRGFEGEIQVQVEGAGRLVALGNASPTDVGSLQDAGHRAYRGVLQAIVKPTGDSGIVRVLASGEGLEPGDTEILVGG